jgi:hypothetical protein
MARYTWTIEETDILIENYNDKTINDFCKMFPNRSRKSIQRKIAQLQAEGAVEYKYNSKNAGKVAEDDGYFSSRKSSNLKGDW